MTQAESERIIALHQLGYKAAEIAHLMGMDRLRVLRRIQNWDIKGITQSLHALGIYNEGKNMKVPPEVFAERDRRLSLAPRSLTAAICGDPLPGYSAMERR